MQERAFDHALFCKEQDIQYWKDDGKQSQGQIGNQGDIG
jgi:hypothetical protein